MTILELLQLEASKRNINQVIRIINQQPELFETLWSIFCQQKNPESRRAAWAIDLLNENLAYLNEKHLETIISMLPLYKHEGYKRHSLRILERNIIPETHKGEVVSICFNWLESPSSAVSVKMFCLKILERIAKEEPIISRELIDIIELQLNDATPGFKSIGLKTIRSLQKLIAIYI